MTRRAKVLQAVAALAILCGASGEAECKNPVTASITFCSKVGKTSGHPFGVADSFALKSGRRIHGVVRFENARPGEDLVLDILWVKPDGKDAFKKREVLTPEETGVWTDTSLSLSPERRDPGTYVLKVFLYRMLLIEKTVELTLPESAE